MKERRFFVRNENIKSKTAVLSREESNHLKNVLRLKKGDSIVLFNGTGEEFEGRIQTLTGRVGIQLGKKLRNRWSGSIAVCLAQALPKKKKMDFIIGKSCELGVEEIFPLETERAAYKLTGPKADHVVERWQRIAVQACKQSRLDWIPQIHKPVKFRELLKKTKNFGAVLIPHLREDLPPLSEVVEVIKERFEMDGSQRSGRKDRRKILVVIGPEGGFSDKEMILAREKKALLFHLGDLILRTDTAAIVGVSLVKYAFNL